MWKEDWLALRMDVGVHRCIHLPGEPGSYNVKFCRFVGLGSDAWVVYITRYDSEGSRGTMRPVQEQLHSD